MPAPPVACRNRRRDWFVLPLLAASLAAVVGCNANVTITMSVDGQPMNVGSGVVVSQQRQLEAFDEIEFAGAGTLVVTNGEQSGVTVTTDDNLIRVLETVVEGNRLRIHPSEGVRTQRGLIYEVTTPTLTAVEARGSTLVELPGLQGDRLRLDIKGASRVTADGQVGRLTVVLEGVSKAFLRDLLADEVEIEMKGAGAADVFARTSLRAEVKGIGKVNVYGNPPQVDQQVSGIGAVVIQ